MFTLKNCSDIWYFLGFLWTQGILVGKTSDFLCYLIYVRKSPYVVAS